MGYLSDVCYGIVFPDEEALAAFAAKVRLTGTEHHKAALEELHVMQYKWEGNTPSAVLLYGVFRDVKWYEDYPDVAAHISIKDMAIKDNRHTKYVVIGEELQDMIEDEWMPENPNYEEADGVAYRFFSELTISRELVTLDTDKATPFADFIKGERHA